MSRTSAEASKRRGLPWRDDLLWAEPGPTHGRPLRLRAQDPMQFFCALSLGYPIAGLPQGPMANSEAGPHIRARAH